MTDAPTTISETIAALWRWLRTNTKQVVVYTVLGGLAGFLYNAYQIAQLGGTGDVVAGQGVVGAGDGFIDSIRMLSDSLWIAAATTLGFSLVSYAWSVGIRQFLRDLAAMPRDLGTLFQRDGATARAHLLWGAAIALVARQFIGPQVGAFLAVGLMIYLPSVFGQVVVKLAMRAVYAVSRLVRPGGRTGSGGLTVVVGALGSIVALAVAAYIDSTVWLLFLAAGCAVGAFVLHRGARLAPAATVFFAVALLTLLFADVPLAWADDGGWSEGGSSLIPWLRSEGAWAVLMASLFVTPVTGLAGLLGGAIGGVMSGGGWGFAELLGLEPGQETVQEPPTDDPGEPPDSSVDESDAQRPERQSAEREAEATAPSADEARRARDAHVDAALDRIMMESRLGDPEWMERWTQAQDAAMEGDASALASLYRDTLREDTRASAAEAAAEGRYEQALAVGEWTFRGIELAARGALMVLGGQVAAAHGVLVAVGATATGMGSIQGASEGAEAQAQGKDPVEVLQRTAGGFLSGAKDGTVGVITGLPGSSGAVRVFLPAATDAAETFIRTGGDVGQTLVTTVISVVGGAAGEGVDAFIPRGATQAATGMVVNATAAGATSVSQGGSFQDGFVEGLASDIATRAGGHAAGHASRSTVEVQAGEQRVQQEIAAEQGARDALAEGRAQRSAPTTIDQQSAAVQALAQTQHDRVRTDADGHMVTDANGNPATDSYVNQRGALDQLRDTAGSRTGKTLDDPNHPGLRDAIVRTRADDIYAPADRATIDSVTPTLQAEGIMRPGDRLVMDTFSTPGETPSLGADRDARLVIERPRVDSNGRPMVEADGSPQMQRIEVERAHWEQQALADFYTHTQRIATEGGRTVTPESHPDYYDRMRDGLERQGHRPAEVARMSPDEVLSRSGDSGRQHAWAEAHNQLFTDRFHVEASRANTDQGVQRVTGEDGTPRAEQVQVGSNTLDVRGGRTALADPEGYARMWQEKSEFYSRNPPEALAQSQKGIAEFMGIRDGYRARGLEPPPVNTHAARAMEIIARAPVGVDATPAAIARVEADLQAAGYRNMGEAMTAVAWQHEGIKWSRPVQPGEPSLGGLRTSQVGANVRSDADDEARR